MRQEGAAAGTRTKLQPVCACRGAQARCRTHRGRQQDEVDVGGQHDDDLLPHHATLCVIHVVHLRSGGQGGRGLLNGSSPPADRCGCAPGRVLGPALQAHTCMQQGTATCLPLGKGERLDKVRHAPCSAMVSVHPFGLDYTHKAWERAGSGGRGGGSGMISRRTCPPTRPLSEAPRLACGPPHLVKDDPLNVPDELSAFVQHGPQDLCCHDEAGAFRADRHVAGQQAHLAGQRGRSRSGLRE